MVYAPNCRTDSRVFINGRRIPAAETDIHIRKEGPLALTRYAEGTFASPLNGEDYLSAFEGATPDEQTNFDTVIIDVKDHVTDEYVRAFRGYVTGVGNDPGPNERIWQFRAEGPGHLLNKVPASKTFRNASGEEILQYVTDELDGKLPFGLFLSADNVGTPQDQAGALPQETSTISGKLEKALSQRFGNVPSPKTFQSNKDTLADVVDWLTDKTETRLWLSPTNEGVGVVATEEPTVTTHTAHYVEPSQSEGSATVASTDEATDDGGNLAIENNNALIELQPANSLTVKGTAKASTRSVSDGNLASAEKIYHEATVRHPDLYRRAGNTALHPARDVVSDAFSKDEVIAEAKSILKDEIDGATDGDMTTLLRGPIRPFDRVRARPTCNSQIAVNAEPITYEVERVHHRIRPDEMSSTKLNVGVHTALDELEVASSSWKEP